MSEVSGFPQWLMMWSPTIWYVTAFLAFWFGSGAFVFRSIMRARHSTGHQQIAADVPQVIQAGLGGGSDRTVWTFSSARVLIGAAFLGPVLSAAFALAYIYYGGRH